MKIKFFVGLFIVFFLCVNVNSKELEGKDLQGVTYVLNANLYMQNYEEIADKLNYLSEVEKEVSSFENDLSDEARFICQQLLVLEKVTAKNSAAEGVSTDPQNKKKDKNDKDAKVDEQKIMDCFHAYEKFAESHENLSSFFHLRYVEIKFATVPYLSSAQQLKILKNILSDYQKIEEMNPNYSENLLNLGISLYFVPGMLGGNKKDAVVKMRKAVQTAGCDYEKVNANLMLSQLLLEEKQADEAKKYLDVAAALAPENRTVQKVLEMNAAGYSIFQADKYRKKK